VLVATASYRVERTTPVLKIGEFSRLAQVTVKALRYYDELGLLRPVFVDRYTSYRYYELEQLARLHRILALKDLGLSLDEVKRLLADEVPVAELRGMLRLRQADLQQHLRDEQERLARVEARLAQLERGDRHQAYDVVLKSAPALRVVSRRATLPRYEAVGEAIGELLAHLARQAVTPAGPPQAVYYDSEYRARDVDVEVAVPLGQARLESTERLSVGWLPAMPELACAVHAGAMADIADAYAALSAWAPANAYRVAGPIREVYLGGPEQGRVVWEVQFPVKSALAALSAAQRSQAMEPKIVDFPGVTVVGIKYVGKNEQQEIPHMWDGLNQRWAELQHPSGLAYGVCRGCTPEEAATAPEGSFAYLAGAEIGADGRVPAGLEAWTVPPGLYAAFACTLGTLQDAYAYVWQTWLPNSTAYASRPAPDFELYPATFEPNGGNQDMFIYIPIQAK
jgi:DNA-binding transcriptional MerR regulator